MPTIPVYIKREIYEWLDAIAKKRGVSPTTIAREIIESYYELAKPKGLKPPKWIEDKRRVSK